MNAAAILEYLEKIANHNLLLNSLMHLVVITALIAVFSIKNKTLKWILFQGSILILFASVTIQAVIFGNPFHAMTFGLMTLLVIVQTFLKNKSVELNGSKPQTVIALLFIAVGLWYPEFVHKNLFALMIFSPVGIIPCPTLLTALGLMTLVYRGAGKLQFGATILMGFIYGIIGTFVLNVYLDITLLFLSLYAAFIYFTIKPDVQACYNTVAPGR